MNSAHRYLGVTPPVSTHPATARELVMTESLTQTLLDLGVLEADEESEKREVVLGRLNQLVKEFVRTVGRQKGLPEDLLAVAGGKIFTFGSYRLGVHPRGADIDTLCVVPQHVERADFFSTFHTMLQEHPDVVDLTKVPDAYVPVTKLKFAGISLDLLFARLAEASVPEDLDLLDNRVLRNLDEKCVLSVNGSRTTDEILRLVPDVGVFHGALRAIKLWAKRRGLYSNAMGYMGGVACALLVARVCQLYPNGAAATIVGRFFRVYAQWNWPQPVMLRHVEDCGLGLKVWNPRLHPADRFHRMPVITPAYPSMCSTHNVTQSTQDLMLTEFRRGAEIMARIERGTESWPALFEDSDFFSRFKHFVQVIASARSPEAYRVWAGFMESRVRILVAKFELDEDIQSAPPFPHGFEATVAEDTDEAVRRAHYFEEDRLLSNADEDGQVKVWSTSFYIAIVPVPADADVQRRGPRRLILDGPVHEFRYVVEGWDKRAPDMIMTVRDVKRDNLPAYIFGDKPRPPKLKRGKPLRNLGQEDSGKRTRINGDSPGAEAGSDPSSSLALDGQESAGPQAAIQHEEQTTTAA